MTNSSIGKAATTTGVASDSNITYDWSSLYGMQEGWLCRRCGKVNAPWVRQCDCHGSGTTITWTSSNPYHQYDTWKDKVTCASDADNVLNGSITYKTAPSTYSQNSIHY